MSIAQINTVAFIGTGVMGAPIARHILESGYRLVVHNRTKKKAEPLLAMGAQWKESPRDVAAAADVVFTMLGYPEDVEDVYLASSGLLAGAKKGTWLIDMTTSSPRLAREIHDAAEVIDVHAFDCPVTGGVSAAQKASLTLIVGEKRQNIEQLLPLLETFSAHQYYFGAPGQGQLAKLCNQLSLAGCMLGYADALALAKENNLDMEQTLAMIKDGMGSSKALAELAPKSLRLDMEPGFFAEYLRKDLSLALENAEDHELTLPGAETAFTLFDLLCEVGGSRLGTQALTLLYEERSVGEQAGLNWSVLDQEDALSDGCEHSCGCGCGHGGIDHDHGSDHKNCCGESGDSCEHHH